MGHEKLQVRWLMLAALLGITCGALKYYFVALVLIFIWRFPRIITAFFFGFVIAWAHMFQAETNQHYIHKIWDQKVQITGQVQGYPQINNDTYSYIFQVQKISNQLLNQPVSIYVQRSSVPVYSADTLTLNAKVKPLSTIAMPGYPRFLRAKKVVGITRVSDVKKLSENPSLPAVWRKLGKQNVEQVLPSPHRLMLLGMLVGVKEKLDPHYDRIFRDSGLYHLLVVSGFNITVVCTFIVFLFRWLPPFFLWSLMGVSVLFYTLICGGDSSVIRAALFGFLAGLSFMVGSRIDRINALLLVLLILGVLNPFLLLGDIGLWLSVSATYAILWGQQYLPVLMGPSTPVYQQWFGISVLAQIGVTPWLGLVFGEVPWVSIITSVLVEPLIPLIMLFGGFVLLGEPFLTPLIAEGLLMMVLYIAELGALVPVLLVPKICFYILSCGLLVLVVLDILDLQKPLALRRK